MCLEFKYDSYFTINQRTYGYSAFHSDMLEKKIEGGGIKSSIRIPWQRPMHKGIRREADSCSFSHSADGSTL